MHTLQVTATVDSSEIGAVHFCLMIWVLAGMQVKQLTRVCAYGGWRDFPAIFGKRNSREFPGISMASNPFLGVEMEIGGGGNGSSGYLAPVTRVAATGTGYIFITNS